ncbi:MAG: acyl-CoA thioesterase [Gammaproteobacteria bacterium]|nr:MAG: acyl-CoA thioesterase [Gammaproteobacteria bacterium]
MTANETLKPIIFEKELEVRDYECDMADGVNNSVYYNYFEHARHSMLKESGIDFAELARKRIGLVVTRAEVDFKRSLMSGDKCVIKSVVRRTSRVRFEFTQEIFKLPERILIATAKIIGVPINSDGRPKLPPELEPLILAMCSPLENEAVKVNDILG